MSLRERQEAQDVLPELSPGPIGSTSWRIITDLRTSTYPNAKSHAIAHVIVENQIALGDELAAERTLHRLMAEELDRHDAVHAIGMVLLGLLNDTMRDAESDAFSNEEYAVALDRLTAEDWRRSADETTTEEDVAPILDDLVAFDGLPEKAITARLRTPGIHGARVHRGHRGVPRSGIRDLP